LLDLIVLERAEDDVFECIRYGAESFGLEQAHAYADALRQRIHWLREFPRAGAVHEHLRGKIRAFKQGRHRIYYSVHVNLLTVIRILHVKQDVVSNME
jgi:toxin ParE1/3/4